MFDAELGKEIVELALAGRSRCTQEKGPVGAIFSRICPHLDDHDPAGQMQIGQKPAGISANFGRHDPHENPWRQGVDCHKITGAVEAFLYNECMVQPLHVFAGPRSTCSFALAA